MVHKRLNDVANKRFEPDKGKITKWLRACYKMEVLGLIGFVILASCEMWVFKGDLRTKQDEGHRVCFSYSKKFSSKLQAVVVCLDMRCIVIGLIIFKMLVNKRLLNVALVDTITKK